MPSPRWKWRQELKEKAERLQKAVAHYDRFPRYDMEDEWFPIERDVTFSAVCIRKLVELNLCDPRLTQTKVNCSHIHSITGRGFGIVDSGSGHWLLEDFDVNNPIRVTLKIFEFVSEIIHASYILPLHDRRDHIRGYALVSPKNHSKRMTVFSTKELNSLIKRFAEDNHDTIEIMAEDMTTGEKTRIR